MDSYVIIKKDGDTPSQNIHWYILDSAPSNDDSHVVIHAMPKEYPVRQNILSALFPFHDPPLPPGTSDHVLMKSATSI